MPASEVMTIEQAVKSTLYKLSQQGRIPANKVCKLWRFRWNAINEWFANDGSETRRRSTRRQPQRRGPKERA